MSFSEAAGERRGEAYFFPYVEPLNEAKTKPAAFFNILHGAALY